MSFHQKLSCFTDNSNSNNKTKEIKKSNKSKIQVWRNTINSVIRVNKLMNKNANYNVPELENLNLLEKIIKLQEDLKIVSSIKQQFEGNQKKMIEKMNKFGSNYYKNKINMKKIFDYCSDNDAEKTYEYNLLTTEQAKEVLKNIYDDVFDFLFLIRNDNKLMLKIIDNCENDGYEDISDFLVNFCYEDTINSTFIQEDMLILIYLLIEKCIIKLMPKEEELKSINQNDIDLYGKYIKENILYYIFLSLTRKADVRNYLCSILPEKIIRVENYRSPLSVEIGRITDYLNNLDEKKRILAENRNTTLKPSNYKGTSIYLKRLSASSSFLDSKKTMSQNKKLKSRLTMQIPKIPNNLMDNEEENNEMNEEKKEAKTLFNNSNYRFKNRNKSGKNLDYFKDIKI